MLEMLAAEAGARTAAARAFANRAAPASRAFFLLPDLPPPAGLGGASDIAALEAAAPLYFAQELEAAGLLAAAEGLARLFAVGAINIGPGRAAELLSTFWRERHERSAPEERAAAYARLFGGGGSIAYAGPDAVNAAFETLLLDLAEAMHRYRTAGPLERAAAAELTRISTAAATLAGNLVPRSGGAAVFVAEEVMEALAQATQIFKEREVQAALGSRGVWQAVRRALTMASGGQGWSGYGNAPAPEALGPTGAHFDRARSGLKLIGWLADTLPGLGGRLSPATLPRDAPILDEATLWMQASLALFDGALEPGHV